jgi:hypothetical protein
MYQYPRVHTRPTQPKRNYALIVYLITLFVFASIFSIYIITSNTGNYKTLYDQQVTINENQKITIGLLEDRIDKLEQDKENLRDNLTDATTKISFLLTENSRLELKRPAYDELTAFLREDDTNEQVYDEYSFVCQNFASQIYVRSKENRFNMSYITVNFKTPMSSGGHVMNGIFLNDGTYGVINVFQDQFFDGSSIDWEKYKTKYAVESNEYTERVYPPMIEALASGFGYSPYDIKIKTSSEVWP